MNRIITLLLGLSSIFTCTAQELDFPDYSQLKIVNLQSHDVLTEGVFQVTAAGRFGENQRLSPYYSGNTSQFSFDITLGIFKNCHLGIAYETLRQTTTGYGKIQVLSEKNGNVLNASIFGSISLNSELSSEEYPKMKFADRYSYATELIISKYCTENLLVQIVPSFIRQNLVWEPTQSHNQLVVQTGAKLYLDETVALDCEYSYNLSRTATSVYKNPISFGISKFVKGNYFQMFISNSQAENVVSVVTNADGNWKERKAFIGFKFSKAL